MMIVVLPWLFACGDAFVPPDPCPTISPSSPEETQRWLENVGLYETDFEMEMRDESWAPVKEEEILSRVPEESGGDVKVVVETVECRRTVCIVGIVYMVGVSGDSWSGLVSREFSDAVVKEPCEVMYPSLATAKERSCGIFEHAVYVRCSR